MDQVLLSSKDHDWITPWDFFHKLNKIYNFTLDAAASSCNHKCSNYFDEKDDALSKDWSNNIVFCNPPYGRKINKWVEKCYKESWQDNTIVVLLCPARPDTKYFHQFIMRAKEVYFVQGRIKFQKEGKKTNSAPFPSMVVVFDGECNNPKFGVMKK